MEDRDIIQLTLNAARKVISGDPELLTNNVHEQALTHRLGIYVEQLASGWHVDCEYNRNGHVIKRLPVGAEEQLPEITDQAGVPIKPDIIVHKRLARNNLLVIEVKKSDNHGVASDDWKLRGMTRQGGQYQYQIGMHLIFSESKAELTSISCYKHGSLHQELTDFANTQLA